LFEARVFAATSNQAARNLPRAICRHDARREWAQDRASRRKNGKVGVAADRYVQATQQWHNGSDPRQAVPCRVNDRQAHSKDKHYDICG
jgi:hypothetical protein